MNSARLLGTNLTIEERAELEALSTRMEEFAHGFRRYAIVVDEGNHDVGIRDYLYMQAWDIKQIARVGTASYGL